MSMRPDIPGGVRPTSRGDVAFWQAPGLASFPWLASGVTERGGGVSEGAFATLNLGLHVGDDAGAVLENRRRAAENLGFSLDRLICAEQVHGGKVAGVTAPDAGRGRCPTRTPCPAWTR